MAYAYTRASHWSAVPGVLLSTLWPGGKRARGLAVLTWVTPAEPAAKRAQEEKASVLYLRGLALIALGFLVQAGSTIAKIF